MFLQGELCSLRAVEIEDVELMYRWENNPEVWHVSGTTAPFSHYSIEAFIEAQRMDIMQSRQLRLIIESAEGEAVGAVDLFEIDPLNRRAGVGILIHDTRRRRHGYATEALKLLEEYSLKVLNLHQLWCNVESRNRASRALFRGAGYIRVGSKRAWNWSPEGWQDEVLYQKIISE